MNKKSWFNKNKNKIVIGVGITALATITVGSVFGITGVIRLAVLEAAGLL